MFRPYSECIFAPVILLDFRDQTAMYISMGRQAAGKLDQTSNTARSIFNPLLPKTLVTALNTFSRRGKDCY